MKDINMKPGWRVSHEPLQKNTKHIDVHNLECFNEVMTIPSNNGWGNDFASFIGRWQPKGTKNKIKNYGQQYIRDNK